MNHANARVWLAAGMCMTSTCAFGQIYGPPDRMVITHIMEPSSMQLKDMNNDSAVSDVDVSMMVLDRLIEIYGQDLNVGDVDGNGVVNGEDMVEAIAKIVRSCFGKTASDASPIGPIDIVTTAQDVQAQTPPADLNFDGNMDAQDVQVTVNNVGADLEQGNTIDTAARELFEYIGAIRELGREYFMATEDATNNHLPGVSSTWPPDHPRWWKENHSTLVSESYSPGGWPPSHEFYDSEQHPVPPIHESNVSKRWPANHLKGSSTTWPPPAGHTLFTTAYTSPAHEVTVSRTWPSSHAYTASSSWPANHEQMISRTWWPQHTQADSSTRVWPPMHTNTISGTWLHQTALSQRTWPSNHYPAMSDTWSPAHTVNISALYPPGHLGYASTTWPGPQPMWPPSHTLKLSQDWSTPAPSPWPPLFPPGHDWFTTFMDLHDVIPRPPWPFANGQ